jgi:Ca-activated chloride channel family protein
MRFEYPHLLWLLAVLPTALAAFFWWAQRRRRRLLAEFIGTRLLPQLTIGVSPARRQIRMALLVLAVASLIVALARPQRGFDLQEVEQRGLDIVVAIDTSKSMLATDIAPNRLERAKLAAWELAQRAATDRVGLVAFAGEAFLECPLTTDNTAFAQTVRSLDVNSIPEGGTALAAAIDTARTAFKESAHYKIVVLLTDGEDNASESGGLAAAQTAAQAGLKIFTIGVGTAAGDFIRVTDANGNSDYVRDEKGDVVKSHLNEPLLRQIAATTGGFYLPLQGAHTIDTLYDRGLAPLPKTQGAARLLRRYHEQFQWPLAAALALLLLEMFLPERKADPAKPKAGPRPIATIVTVLAVAAVLRPEARGESPSDAAHAYATQHFAEAQQAFDRLAATHADDLRFVFNAGAAAYRAGKFDVALKDFQAATLAPDLRLQQAAFYNLGDAQYRLGEQQFKPESAGLDAVEAAWRQAADSYAHAVQLDAKDGDAAYNQAFVNRQLAAIRDLREAMRRAKQSADEAVRRNEFHHALAIMESLNSPIAAQRFKDYVQKLKDIDAIVVPPER